MKALKIQLISVAILALAGQRSYTLAEDYDAYYDDIETSTIEKVLRALTPEEEALANQARAHIAKAIENNLVRLFAIISARGDRQSRQDEEIVEGAEDILDVTPNPNVLPQVAQILGAIFSGSLNITRVVDRTFGLVPNIVRNQVGGIVKLLTGENMEAAAAASATTSATSNAVGNAPAAGPGPSFIVTAPPPPVQSSVPAAPAPVVENVTARAASQTAESAPAPTVATTPKVLEESTAAPEITSTTAAPSYYEDEEVYEVKIKARPTGPSASASNELTSKVKYRVKHRVRPTSTSTPNILEDDEIERLEEDIRRAAKAYEPYVRDKQPRNFADMFRNIFQRIDFNMTEITRNVPSIFKGARQAFVVLESLGLLDVNDVLDELDLPALQEEE
ncbi:hypothetical protein Ocin01_15536 [Orchesella cincta]|uniref:Uncharacterized protein n=1 Tax=Orchesella cincta TaxID=48709 RepID=A0A1D2MDQ2_ORCCI|nr:hypothetical protein Ocin01_15536 [Orchesella cincta]